MTKSKATKDLARQLYQDGANTEDIAIMCKTSQRTIQRWIKKFQSEPRVANNSISVDCFTNDKNDVSDPLISQESLDIELSENLDLTITPKMANRLLRLTEKALVSLENCLSDPEAKPTDKIKAASLIGEWAGLKGSNVVKRISHAFDLDLNPELVDTSTGNGKLIPRKVLKAQEIKEENYICELEELEKEKEYYNNELSRYFDKHHNLPTELDDKLFDLHSFLSIMEYDEFFPKEYEKYIKCRKELVERGYDLKQFDSEFKYFSG